MLLDAAKRITPDTTAISGGAAWADHLAVKLFLAGKIKHLELHLPSTITNGRFDGDRGTSGGASNYYHDKFSTITGENSINQIIEAINRGATVTYEPNAMGYKAMFTRNSKVANSNADTLLAYTFGNTEIPADGGTLHTWNMVTTGIKHHIQINKLTLPNSL